MNLTGILFTLAGGVGLFLYGIRLMSEALQFIAGNRMRRLIGTLTKTPLRGVFIGMLVTVLIQSSTGTTVMTVSFVNAGLLTLKQAIGLIMGANVGTTVTSQIIAFEIEEAALPLIAVGVGLFLFGRTKPQTYLGNGITGLGLLFMGMQTMEAATPFIASHREFLFFLSHNPLLGVLTGIILTVVIQSSAATIGLTMAMASQGLITIDAAIPIILGDNLGTTLTAALAAVGTNRNAKQAAAAHVLFNLFGVCLFLALLPLYRMLIVHSAADAGRQVANAHTIFNVANTIIFLPFVSLFAKLIERLIPAGAGQESLPEERALYLDPKLVAASPTAAVQAVKDELMRMGDIVRDMMDLVRLAYSRKEKEQGKGKEKEDKDLPELRRTFDAHEKAVNALNRAITSYASEIWQKGLPADVSTVLGCYVGASSDLERVGDHSENLIELCDPLSSCLSEEASQEFMTMLDTADEALNASLASLRNEDTAEADRVILELEDRIDEQERAYRRNHIGRLHSGRCDPEEGVGFVDLLSNLERIGDHSHNLAYYTHDIAALKKTKTKNKI